MVELTVANVAGVIAAVIFIAHHLVPNALAIILSRLLGSRNTAASWTVASAAFQQSQWPFFLQTDSHHYHGVPKSIFLVTKLFPLMGVCLAVAGIMTPLGLYDTFVAGDKVQARFVYAADTSPFGYGTPPRSNYSWARLCRSKIEIAPCPFSESQVVVTAFPNGTTSYEYLYGYNLSVPQRITETFSSGTADDTTVSNFFDIQWRRYSIMQNPMYNNNSRYIASSNTNMDNIVLSDAKSVIEGLVVDTQAGGVGFRNHTIPSGFAHGVDWSEDLLFVEPQSVCVDTNLTLDFTIANSNNTVLTGVSLTDRGGFARLNHTYPEYVYQDTQQDPDLYRRAYKAAWLHNAFTALYLNVTNPQNGSMKAWSYMNSEMNKTYQIKDSQASINGYDSLSISTGFNDYISSVSFNQSSIDPVKFNPWKITATNYSTINLLCGGAGSGDNSNISNIMAGCGLMRTPPHRTDAGSNLVFETGSSWSQKIFTCATVVKASVKTVSFDYQSNSADARLSDLVVRDISPKTYADKSSMPLWGVEDTGNAYRSGELHPVWGLLSQQYEKSANVSAVRQPWLYLPGWFDFGSGRGFLTAAWRGENMPASDFPLQALAAAYSVQGTGPSSSLGLGTGVSMDYTGHTSLAMYARWQNLTQTAETAGLIPNLIFTDNAASAVVGTKGTLGSMNSASRTLANVQVTPMKSSVRYHYAYGIPAFICAILLALVLGLAALAACTSLQTLSRLRKQLQDTSAGRIYTVFLYGGEADLSTRAKVWNKRLGDRVIDLSGDMPVRAETDQVEAGEQLPLTDPPEKPGFATSSSPSD